MSDESYFDRSALARLHKLGGDEFVRKMINLFFDYAPKRLAAAQTGTQIGDLHAVEQALHPLKSSAGQLGAVRVQQLAAEIEALAVKQEAASIPTLLAQLEAALIQIKPDLEQVREHPAP